MAQMTTTDIGVLVASSVIIVINLLGNGAVCLLVLRYRSMRAPINYLLVNLAVSDMMVALAIAGQYVIKWTFHYPNGTAGDYLCKFVTGGNFIWIGGINSAFSLVVIAIERYFAIVRPLRDRFHLTKGRLIAIITTGWVFSLIYNVPLFFVLRHKNGENHCREHWENRHLGELYSTVCAFAYGAIPIVTMAFLYSKVLYKLWKSGINATQLTEQARIRARLKVTKMVVIVSIIYAVCWIPNLVIYMIAHFKPQHFDYGAYTVVFPFVLSVVLVGLNSTINPFIYALHSTKFRQHIKLLLSCKSYKTLDANSPESNRGATSSAAGIFGSGYFSGQT